MQGSTEKFFLMNGGASCSLSSPTTPGQGQIGSFVIDMGVKDGGEPFTTWDAQNNKLFVGFADSRDGKDIKIMSTFTPQPNMVYNIKPRTIFYLVAG
ncbi:hypothetical protein MN608_10567 [Microdochium nivale]|nr:hypothetical protein MN608_10567 [Microdochium nivale]